MLLLAPVIAGIACMVIAVRRGRSALVWGAIGLCVGLMGSLVGGIVGSMIGFLTPTGTLEFIRTTVLPILGVVGSTYLVIKRIQRPVGDRKRPKASDVLVLILSFLGGLTVLAVIAGLLQFSTQLEQFQSIGERERGVKLSGEMDAYALEYLSTHNLLNSSETLVAYYDHTWLMNGMVATILTNERLISHDAEDGTTATRFPQIENIGTSIDVIGPDERVYVIFEIKSNSGEVLMMFSIAADDSAETFKNLLMDAWEGTK